VLTSAYRNNGISKPICNTSTEFDGAA